MTESENQVETERAAVRDTRNAALSLIYQMVGAAFTAGLTIFLVRMLGPGDYGIFVLATSVGAIAILFSDFGMSASASRFVSATERDPEMRSAVLLAVLRLKTVAALLMSLLLVVLADPIADAYGIEGLAGALRIIAIAVFGQSMMYLVMGYFEAVSRNEGGLLVATLESASEVASSVLLVLLGAGVAGALTGRAIGYGVAGALTFYFILRAINFEKAKRVATAAVHRRIFSYAFALTIIDGAMVLFSRTGVLLIGAYLGSASVGVFEAPLRLTVVIEYVGVAMASGFAPRLARDEGESGVSIFTFALRRLILFQMIAAVLLVVWATPLTAIVLGEEYVESADVLRSLGLLVFLSGLAAMSSVGVNYVGEARKRIPIALAVIAINLVLAMILIPWIGIIGASISASVGFLIYVPAHIWILRSKLGMQVLPMLRTTLVAAVAAAVACIPPLVIGTGRISLPLLIFGGLAALALYLGALIALREITPGEIRRVVRMVPIMGRASQ